MITIAQIGVGEWGRNLLRTFSNLPDCRVKYFCDQNPATIEKLNRFYHGKIQGVTNYEIILNDPEIKAVIIASPPITHAELVLQALKANKHVFVEKPLALSISDAERMILGATEQRRILVVGHLLLYHPAIRKLKSYIDEGQLGDIHYLYSTRVNLGRIRDAENALWSLTAHDISVAMYLLEDMPQRVTATGSSYLRQGVEDVVFVTLYFEKNVMSHIHASWLDPHKVRKFTIVGSQKMAVFDDMESSEKVRLYDKGVSHQRGSGQSHTSLTVREGDIYIPRIDIEEPLTLECQHFLDCIQTGKNALSDGENGLSVLRVLTAAQESMESNGKPIQISYK